MTVIFTILALLVGLCATPVSAQGPPLPHTFYGAVEINDSPAPVGTEVEARGEGVLTGIEGNPITVTEAGMYGGPGPSDPKLVVQGDIEEGATITFYVNGVVADQTVEWHSGEITELDLTVTIPIAPPTVSTETATGIGNTAATLNGILTDLGDASSVEVSFEWGTTTDYGNETDTQTMTSTGSFRAVLSHLTADATYHFRAKAVGEGTSYGIDRTFATLGEASEVPPTEEAPPTEEVPPTAPPPTTPPTEAPPEVKLPINWPVLGGIIAGVVIVGLIIFLLARRKTA